MMDREEAKRFWLIRYENAKDFSDPHWEAQERREHREYVEALRMAIEALSAEQKEEDLANDIARRMATIIENEQDMRVILKNASSEPTDLISRSEVLDIIAFKRKLANIDGRILLDETVDRINALPSAEQVTSKLKNPCDSLLKDDSESCKEQKSKLDLISRADAINEIHKYFVEEIDKTPTEIDEDGDELYADMPTVNSLLACNKELSKRIKAIQSADRPSGEWVEKEVMVDEDANITEWQSAKCSVCGKYHTTPYLYYFDSFNYCPNCGAKMGSDTR